MVAGESSLAAQLGTARHTLAEICLTNGQDASEYVDRNVGGFVVDAQAADDVQLFLDTVREWPEGGDPLQIEVRFDLAPLNPPGPMFGTSDVVRYYPEDGTLRIGDYKNGWIPVAVGDNPQIKYYAIGAVVALGPDKPVRRVVGYIVQPNAGGVKMAEFDVGDLVEWSLELMARAKAALDPAAPASAGSWCRFCTVRAACGERAAYNLHTAAVELPAIASALPPDVATLTDDQRATILERAGEFSAWLKSIEEYVLARGGIPGRFKVVPTRPSISWQNEDEAGPMLQMAHEVADPFAPKKLRTYATIRDELVRDRHAAAKAAKLKTTKKAIEAEVVDLLRPLVVRSSSGTKLVPASDPQAATAAGGLEFSSLPAAEG